MFTKNEVIMMITIIATTVLIIAGYLEYRIVYDMAEGRCRRDAQIEANKIYVKIAEELRLLKLKEVAW